MKMRKAWVGVMTLVMLALAVVQAPAQNVVVLAGNDGVLAAGELQFSNLVLRAGAISHNGATAVDWVGSIGGRWGDRVTVDAALDFEDIRERLNQEGEPIDFRARVGVGYKVADNAAGIVEYSRSFHNGTPEGRLLVGVRFGFM